MPTTPQGLITQKLHMHFVEPDSEGTPLQGTLTFTPNPSIIMFPDENVMVAGTETATLDELGEATIELVAVDNPGSNPAGWTYTVLQKIVGQRQRSYDISVGYIGEGTLLELSDLTPTEDAPTYLPVVGPQGAPGVVQSVNGISLTSVVLTAADVNAVDIDQLGVAEGVATLGVDGKLTAVQVPDDLPGYVPISLIGAANGVASLDGDNKIPVVQIPDLGGSYLSAGLLGTAGGVTELDDNGLVISTQLGLATVEPGAIGTGAVGISSTLARGDHTHDGVGLTGDQQISGIKTFLDNLHLGSSLGFALGAGDPDVTLSRSAAGVLSSSGQLAVEAAAPTDDSHLTRKDYVDSAIAAGGGGGGSFTTDTAPDLGITVRVSGDANPRIAIGGDGEIYWGTGAAAVDTTLARAGISALTTNASVLSHRTATGDVAFSALIAADTFDRYRTYADGKLEWGPGTATRDTNLYRTASGVLKTDGNLIANYATFAGQLNVRTYGAKGDGVTGDSAAINTALASATVKGGQVIVPAGIYLIDSVLRIYRNTRLTLLPGAEFRIAYAGTMLLNGDAAQNLGGYTGHGNITIEGGVWNMRGTTAGFTGNAMCISIGHATDILIQNVTIKDVSGFHGIELNSTKRGRVINCTFLGYVDNTTDHSRGFSEAVQLDLAKSVGVFGGFGPYDNTPCEDILIEGCYFGASGTAGTIAWPRGIGSHSATVGIWHRRIRIIGNSFEGVGQYGVSAYNYASSLINSNTFRGCGSGIRCRVIISSDAADSTNTSGVQTNASQNMDNVAITGNVLEAGTGYDDPIICMGEATGLIRDLTITGNTIDTSTNSENGIRLEQCQRAVVSNNSIANVSGTGLSTENVVHGNYSGNEIYTPGAHGITAVTCSLTMITGNQVKYAANNGLLIQGGSDIQVIGNFVKAAGRAVTATWYGIRLSSSAASVMLRNNKTRPNGSGNEAIAGFSVTSTCTNVIRAGNDWRGAEFTTSALDDQAASNTTATDLS